MATPGRPGTEMTPPASSTPAAVFPAGCSLWHCPGMSMPHVPRSGQGAWVTLSCSGSISLQRSGPDQRLRKASDQPSGHSQATESSGSTPESCPELSDEEQDGDFVPGSESPCPRCRKEVRRLQALHEAILSIRDAQQELHRAGGAWILFGCRVAGESRESSSLSRKRPGSQGNLLGSWVRRWGPATVSIPRLKAAAEPPEARGPGPSAGPTAPRAQAVLPGDPPEQRGDLGGG
nr:uncharacterized protein LOC110569511 [Aotus nancymaae]